MQVDPSNYIAFGVQVAFERKKERCFSNFSNFSKKRVLSACPRPGREGNVEQAGGREGGRANADIHLTGPNS